jgi:hypothetical protein
MLTKQDASCSGTAARLSNVSAPCYQTRLAELRRSKFEVFHARQDGISDYSYKTLQVKKEDRG